MDETSLSPTYIAILAALADGIIPADDRDAGAASVDAALVIAERLQACQAAQNYAEELKAANDLARSTFGQNVIELTPEQTHQLLQELLEASPGLFRQLRADVCGIYLSDPDVWERIGFPGPSTDNGGYPDFDQVQF